MISFPLIYDHLEKHGVMKGEKKYRTCVCIFVDG